MQTGIALLVSTTPKFFQADDERENSTLNWKTILRYFYDYRQLLSQLTLGLVLSTLFSLAAPFLTQSIVDVGVNTRDLNYIYLLLSAQVMLFLGSTAVDFIRSWILLHISTRVNLSILSDFLIKLMKLPINFFEKKTTGDILQRVSDQQRIESFLTSTTLSAFFSAVNLFFFTIILFHYSPTIFAVSIASAALYIGWITMFLNRRRELNHKQFENESSNQDKIVELVNGIQDIKLNNCEQRKRWSWEHLQIRLFQYKIQRLSLTQYQQGGGNVINQAKNILITFLSVKAVIDGHLTIGGMMAIQYIAGQISGPIDQVLGFVQSYQDAKISLERLSEIHQLDNEEPANKTYQDELPSDKHISITDLSFTYPGVGNTPVLQNISLRIPQGKTTAIVGLSGSGKTTLLKLLLGIYETAEDEIKIGAIPLKHLKLKTWRTACGTVMQDSYIFSDSIENNISISDETPDRERVIKAVEAANLTDFIDDQPFGLDTKIGSSGNGLSQGQKQRLLIARAIYKNPDYLFFDEATNALDSKNERKIMDNLNNLLIGKTVVVVAHRLSTVSNADNIIVLSKGKIIEQGTHLELTDLRGEYFSLVKNQLELGS